MTVAAATGTGAVWCEHLPAAFAVADALPELLMLDGVTLERPPPGHPEDDDGCAPRTGVPPMAVTIKFKVTNASCEPDPPIDDLGDERDGDNEKGSRTEDVDREKGKEDGGHSIKRVVNGEPHTAP